MRRRAKRKTLLLAVGMAVILSVNFLQPVVWAVETDGISGVAAAENGGGQEGKTPAGGTDAGLQKGERPTAKNPAGGTEPVSGVQKNEKPSENAPEGTASPGGTAPAEGEQEGVEPPGDDSEGPSAASPDKEPGPQEGEDVSGENPEDRPPEDKPEGGESSGGDQEGEEPAESPDTDGETAGGEPPAEGADPDGELPEDRPDGEVQDGEAIPGEGQEGEEPGEAPVEGEVPPEGEPGAELPAEGTETLPVPSPELPPEAVVPQAPPAANTSGKITLDGSSSDWDDAKIGALSPVDGADSGPLSVSQWRVARGEDGSVYLCIQGDANEYETGNAQWMNFYVTQNGQTVQHQVSAVPGGAYNYQCKANGTSKAPFVLEVKIPAEYFTDPDFMITFGGCNAPAGTIPVLDGVAPEPVPEKPVYSGIGIDGGFSDWGAVNKHDPHDANQCIDQMGVVYDGDVYVYIREVNGGSAAGSGTHSNGKFAITTDLGEVLLFQLNEDGTISGPAGAEAVRVGGEWEIRIPGSALPRHRQTISVGLYMAEPAVSDVANLQGGGNTGGSFDGIKVDGDYSDWDTYPSTQIQYATAGTQESVSDARASLYNEGSVLYGHAVSNMPQHLDSKGGDFLSAISITFNGDRDYKGNPTEGNFYPALRRQDSGEILNSNSRLENGTYTFEILDTRTAGNNPQVYGTVVLTVNGYQDEMEFTLDLEKVAAYTGMNVQDMKLIEAQFGRLGQEWVSTAGTSSGPWLLVLAAAPAAALLACRRKREYGA